MKRPLEFVVRVFEGEQVFVLPNGHATGSERSCSIEIEDRVSGARIATVSVMDSAGPSGLELAMSALRCAIARGRF